MSGGYQTAPNAQGLWLASKAGGCRTGSDGHGTVFHALTSDPGGSCIAALCGARPAIQWSSWLPVGQLVTCPRCLKKIAKQECKTK